MLSTSGWTDAVTGAALDAQWIEDLINRRLGDPVMIGGRMMAVDYSFQPVAMLLPPADSVFGLPQASNDLASILQPSTCQISADITKPVARTIQFTLNDPITLEDGQALPFDPLQHLVQPTALMKCQGQVVEFPLGTYMLDTPKATLLRGLRTYAFTGTDLMGLVALADLISDWTVSADYPGGYVQAYLDLVTSHATPKSLGGLGQTPQGNDDAGPAIPLDMIDVDWTGNQTVVADIPFRAGDNRAQDGATLADAMNYWPLWMDNTSRFILRPIPDIPNVMPPVTWDYSATGLSTIAGPIQQQFSSVSKAANIVRVNGGASTAVGGSTYTSLQVNNNPFSDYAYPNLPTLSGEPRAIAQFKSDTSLANQQMTDFTAKLMLLMGQTLADQVTVSTLTNPLTELYEYYVMEVPLTNGVIAIASDAAHPYFETGWQMNWMDPAGKHQHNLIRLGAL